MNYSYEEIRASEARWRILNTKAKNAGCKCGREATHVTKYPVLGCVPCEIWTCQDHVGTRTWLMDDEDTSD